MKNKSLRTKKKLLISAVALMAIMATALPIFSAYAENDAYDYVPPPGNVGSVQDAMRNEARAQLAVKTLLNCIGGGVNRDTSWGDTEDTSKWFNRLGDDMTVTTGYWYEYELTGKYDDGQINCSETGHSNVVSIVADQLGVGKKDVFCNGNAAGIAYNKGGYNCGTSNGKYTRNGNNGGDGLTSISVTDGNGVTSTAQNQGWFKHVKMLYDNKKNAEHWETSIYNIATYGGMAGYFLYRTEINSKCGGVVETTDTKPSNMDMVMMDVTQDATQAGKIVYKKYGQNSDFSHEFVVRDDIMTCKGMIKRINEESIWKKYLNRMLVVLNNNCREDIEKRKAAIESRGEEMNEETKAAYDAAVADTSEFKAGQFLTGNETDGWDCADIGDWAGGEQADPTVDEEPAERGKMCMDNAGALGWIACNLADGLSNAIQGLYEKWVVPYLEVHASLFSTEGDATNVFNAWQIFQNFANLFFIGVLFFIIFSQITGYGIDNYGIKRTLPKLIVGAILINTSFVISALAVDLSNILGIGIGNLFKGITEGITVTSVTVDDASASGGGGIVTFAASGAAITAVGLGLVTLLSAGMASGPMLFYGGIALLIPILMGLLSIFLAILFFFLLLCLRQALIVILVVVSPVAFACYMLENTKPIFGKWFKAFKAALLAYPIASALVYGGQSIGSLLIAAEAGASGAGSGTVSVQMMLAAAVMSVAPIFLIPNAIKGSMSGLDAITNKLSGAVGSKANKLGGKAQDKFGKSAFYQRAADSAKSAENDKMMNKVRARQKKLDEKLGKRGELSNQQRREYARNASILATDSNRIMGEYQSGYRNKTQDEIGAEFEDKDAIEKSFMTVKKNRLAGTEERTFDVEKAAAALSSIQDSDKRVAAYRALSKNADFQAAMSNKATGAANRDMIASVMAAKQGDAAGLAIAKNIRASSSASDIGDTADANLGSKFAGLGTSAMTGIDKDNFAITGAADMFSDDQLRAGLGLGYSGGTADKFNTMLGSIDQPRLNQIASGMSAEQVGGLSVDNLAALAGKQMADADNKPIHYTLDDFSEEERTALQQRFESSLKAVNGDSGDAIRSKMNADVMTILGVSPTKGPQQVIVIDHSGSNNSGTAGGDPQFG